MLDTREYIVFAPARSITSAAVRYYNIYIRPGIILNTPDLFG